MEFLWIILIVWCLDTRRTGITGYALQGRDFVVSFNYQTSATIEDLFVVVINSGQESCTVTVKSSPSNPLIDVTKTVGAGQSIEVQIPSELQLAVIGIEEKAILIQSTRDITVIGHQRIKYSNDAFTVYPIAILGYEHFAVTHCESSRICTVSVVASESDTSVTIYLPGTQLSIVFNGNTYKANSVINLNLNNFETFLIKDDADLTGTRIVANKPVVVYSGNDRSNLQYTYIDHFSDQVIPLYLIGTEYIIANAGFKTRHYIKIVTSVPDTSITITSDVVENVQLSQMGENIIRNFDIALVHVKASHPVTIVHFIFDSKGNTAMYFVTPVDRYDVTYDTYGIGSFSDNSEFTYNNYVVIIIEDGYRSEVMIDDVCLTPDNGWSSITIQGKTFSSGIFGMSLGSHVVKHLLGNIPLWGYVVGTGASEVFATALGIKINEPVVSSVIPSSSSTTSSVIPSSSFATEATSSLSSETVSTASSEGIEPTSTSAQTTTSNILNTALPTLSLETMLYSRDMLTPSATPTQSASDKLNPEKTSSQASDELLENESTSIFNTKLPNLDSDTQLYASNEGEKSTVTQAQSTTDVPGLTSDTILYTSNDVLYPTVKPTQFATDSNTESTLSETTDIYSVKSVNTLSEISNVYQDSESSLILNTGTFQSSNMQTSIDMVGSVFSSDSDIATSVVEQPSSIDSTPFSSLLNLTNSNPSFDSFPMETTIQSVFISGTSFDSFPLETSIQSVSIGGASLNLSHLGTSIQPVSIGGTSFDLFSLETSIQSVSIGGASLNLSPLGTSIQPVSIGGTSFDSFPLETSIQSVFIDGDTIMTNSLQDMSSFSTPVLIRSSQLTATTLQELSSNIIDTSYDGTSHTLKDTSSYVTPVTTRSPQITTDTTQDISSNIIDTSYTETQFLTRNTQSVTAITQNLDISSISDETLLLQASTIAMSISANDQNSVTPSSSFANALLPSSVFGGVSLLFNYMTTTGIDVYDNASSTTRTTDHCQCACAATGNSSLPSNFQKDFDNLISKLRLNKTKLSSYQRKLTSADDHRMSAKFVGSAGIIIMVLVSMIIVIPDIVTWFQTFRVNNSGNSNKNKI